MVASVMLKLKDGAWRQKETVFSLADFEVSLYALLLSIGPCRIIIEKISIG
jgi:hypothetical protein